MLAFQVACGKLRGLRLRILKRWLNTRVALAIGAGLALAAAFPKPGLAGLAWIAPGLMLLAALGASPGRAFRLGYAAGLACSLASLYWLLFIPFPAGAIASWLALSAYLALYPAVWVWLGWRLFPCPAPTNPVPSLPLHHSTTPPIQSAAAAPNAHLLPTSSGVRRWLAWFATVQWSQRTGWCLTCAALWVALELLRGWFLTGFPWNLLGVSQYRTWPLVQLASVTGVYGISFLMVWGATALLCTGLRLAGQLGQSPLSPTAPTPGSRAPWRFPLARPKFPLGSFRLTLLTDLALPLLVLTGIMVIGTARLVQAPRANSELRVALVQPNIPQRLIFDPKETGNRFHKLLELSQLALAARPDLLVWPEASLPGLDEANYRALTNLIAARKVWMIFGADDAEARPEAAPAKQYDYYNSAFLFDPNGRYVATYRKRRLVIFGEYVPLEEWLPLVKRLTPIEGSFTPGKAPVSFELKHPRAKIGVLICFEDVFAQSARESALEDTDFLLNLTNNGWFGESAAQWQHAANAVFRAVENGLPLVRCTNNGLTCWVDAYGRLREAGLGDDRDIYAAGLTVVRIPLLAPGQKRSPTFYRQHGDWFAWGGVGWSALAIAVWQWRKATAKPPDKASACKSD